MFFWLMAGVCRSPVTSHVDTFIYLLFHQVYYLVLFHFFFCLLGYWIFQFIGIIRLIRIIRFLSCFSSYLIFFRFIGLLDYWIICF